MRKHIKIPKNLTFTFSVLLAIVYTCPHLSVGFLRETFHNSDIVQGFFRRENLPFSVDKTSLYMDEDITKDMIENITKGDLIFIFTH